MAENVQRERDDNKFAQWYKQGMANMGIMLSRAESEFLVSTGLSEIPSNWKNYGGASRE